MLKSLYLSTQVWIVILLLTAVFITGHVTRGESYPPLRARRRGVVEEKLPDTNGMFFGKRSSPAALRGIKLSQDSPFSSLSHSHHKVPPVSRKHGIGKADIHLLEHGTGDGPKKV